MRPSQLTVKFEAVSQFTVKFEAISQLTIKFEAVSQFTVKFETVSQLSVNPMHTLLEVCGLTICLFFVFSQALNDTSYPPVATLDLQIAVTVLYAISFIVAMVGNVLVLLIIWKKPETRTTISYLFLNMTISDFLVALIVMPYSVAFYFRNYKWPLGAFGDLLCKLCNFGFTTSISASVLTLMFIAFNRYFAVVHPLQRRIALQNPKVATIIIWVTSFAIVSPFLGVATNQSPTDAGNCVLDWKQLGIDGMLPVQIAFIFFAVVLFLIPLSVMAVLYSIIGIKLHHHKTPGNVQAGALERARAANRKVIRVTASIVAAFGICYFPMHFQHVFVWCFPVFEYSSLVLMMLCFWFGHLNSAVNPCMYIAFDTKMRKAFLELIGKHKNSRPAIPVFAKAKVLNQTKRSLNAEGKEVYDTKF